MFLQILSVFTPMMWIFLFIFVILNGIIFYLLSPFDYDDQFRYNYKQSKDYFYFLLLVALPLLINSSTVYRPKKWFIKIYLATLSLFGVLYFIIAFTYLMIILEKSHHWNQISTKNELFKENFILAGTEDTHQNLLLMNKV